MSNEPSAHACAPGVCGCQSGVDRRTMLSQGVLLAAAAVLAACTGGFDIPSAPASVSASIKVSDFPSLANVGGVAAVSASGSPVAVVRTGAESFIALSRICPHQGSTISILANEFQCPRHGATFDTNGQWIGGQPTSNMRQYATTYTAATGMLQIG